MTLLYYTLQCLEENGKTLADVQWIGNNNFCIEISDFITHSQNLELDDCKVNGVSLETLPTDLYIVGNDFWLARPVMYNEDLRYLSDIWIFNTKPEMPKAIKKIRTLSAKQLPKNEKWEGFKVTLENLVEK